MCPLVCLENHCHAHEGHSAENRPEEVISPHEGQMTAHSCTNAGRLINEKPSRASTKLQLLLFTFPGEKDEVKLPFSLLCFRRLRVAASVKPVKSGDGHVSSRTTPVTSQNGEHSLFSPHGRPRCDSVPKSPPRCAVAVQLCQLVS